ncbi:zinc ribbon domain-containing protein [Lachnospiraceae bacterium ZAX-1]
MDFFQKLGDTISATGKDVSQKAKEITDIAKLNLDIKSKEGFIRRQYEEIGRKYYELHKNEEEPFVDEITAIDKALEEITRMQAEIAELRGFKKCEGCGAFMDWDAQYCNKCGQKWADIYEEE